MSGPDRHDAGTDCRRTPGLRDRLIAGSVTVDDREHAATCASCGPVIARAARFDQELGRVARSLITEELPRDILDPAIEGARGFTGVRSRRSVPGLSAMFGVIAILLAATAMWIAPMSPQPAASPDTSANPTKIPGPLFHPTTGIVARVIDLDYRCNDGTGKPIPTGANGIAAEEVAVCTGPASLGFETAILIGASDGGVVTVVLKGDVHSELGDNPSDTGNLAIHLSDVAEKALVGAYEARRAEELILGQLPRLEPGGLVRLDEDGMHIEIARHDSTTFTVRIDALARPPLTAP